MAPFYLQSQQWIIESFSHCIILTLTPLSHLLPLWLFCLPLSLIWSLVIDYIKSIQISQDNIPISNALNPISFAKSLLPFKMIYLQFHRLGINIFQWPFLCRPENIHISPIWRMNLPPHNFPKVSTHSSNNLKYKTSSKSNWLKSSKSHHLNEKRLIWTILGQNFSPSIALWT